MSASGSKGKTNSTNYGANNGFNQNGSVGTQGSFGSSIGGSQGGSSGSSFGSTESSSTSSQDVWSPQGQHLQDMYGNAAGAANNASSMISGLTPGVMQTMGNALQMGGGLQNQMGQGGAFGGLNSNAAIGNITGSIGNSNTGGMLNQMQNPTWVQGMKDQVSADANRLKQQNLGSLEARAAAAGMSGSSGYRNQANQMADQVDRNALSQMRGFDMQNIQNQMGMAGAADQSDIARQSMMNQMLQGQNSSMNSAMQFSPQMQQMAMNMYNPASAQMAPWQQLGGILGGPTVLGQSQSNSKGMQGSTQNSFNNAFNNSQNASFGDNASWGYGANVGSNTGNSSGKQGSASLGLF